MVPADELEVRCHVPLIERDLAGEGEGEAGQASHFTSGQVSLARQPNLLAGVRSSAYDRSMSQRDQVLSLRKKGLSVRQIMRELRVTPGRGRSSCSRRTRRGTPTPSRRKREGRRGPPTTTPAST